MRQTLDTIDPLPAFPSDGIAFELQDAEPAYEPSERHKRLPSYREMLKRAAETSLRRGCIKEARKGVVWFDSKQSITEIARFNGNCRPEITEADCRKSAEPKTEAPAEIESEEVAFDRWLSVTQPKADADGWIEWEGGREAPEELLGRRLMLRFASGNTHEMGAGGLVDRGGFGWTHSGPEELRIVAYKVVA